VITHDLITHLYLHKVWQQNKKISKHSLIGLNVNERNT